MKKLLTTACILGIILVTVSCAQKPQTNPVDTQPEQGQPEEAAQQTVQAFGIIKTKQIKGIMIDLPAVIEKVHVQEGQKVKKGDTLITLSLKEIEEQIKEKEDSLKIAQLELQKLMEDVSGKVSGSVDYEPDIMQAKNNLEKDQTEYEKLKKDLENNDSLLREGAISQNEYDELKITVEQKQKEMENAKIKLDDLKKQQTITNTKDTLDIAIKKQNIASLESKLQTLKDKIEESGIQGNKIICDIENGIIEKINNSAGDRLNDEKQIMSILDTDTLIVEANVAEDFIKDIKTGNKAIISPLADAGKEYQGTVARISNMAIEENGETVVPVEISIDKIDEFLLPNFNVNIKIIIEE
ncbi:MAG: HlyD family secretion protein [Clostridia bacterium]